jgi:PAS domain S-box-containing protein
MMTAPMTLVASVSSENDAAGQDQALYRFLVDSLTEYAVFAVSPSGVVMSWNAGAEKTFGFTQAEIIGRPFEIIFTSEGRASGRTPKRVGKRAQRRTNPA